MAALSPSVEVHYVVIDPDGLVKCECKGFTVHADVWGSTTARRLAWGHIAAPSMTVEELLVAIASRDVDE